MCQLINSNDYRYKTLLAGSLSNSANSTTNYAINYVFYDPVTNLTCYNGHSTIGTPEQQESRTLCFDSNDLSKTLGSVACFLDPTFKTLSCVNAPTDQQAIEQCTIFNHLN